MTRRDFLKVVFATIPATAVSGPLKNIWPSGAFDRPVEEPYIISIDDSGYLYDPNFNYDDQQLPSGREHCEYDNKSWDEKKYFLEMECDAAENYQITHADEFSDGWNGEYTEAQYRSMEASIQDWLDEPIDIEELSMLEGMTYTEHWPVTEIMSGLSSKDADALMLAFVEGEHPGSSFAGVKYIGDISDLGILNNALAQKGMNLVVIAPTG